MISLTKFTTDQRLLRSSEASSWTLLLLSHPTPRTECLVIPSHPSMRLLITFQLDLRSVLPSQQTIWDQDFPSPSPPPLTSPSTSTAFVCYPSAIQPFTPSLSQNTHKFVEAWESKHFISLIFHPLPHILLFIPSESISTLPPWLLTLQTTDSWTGSSLGLIFECLAKIVGLMLPCCRLNSWPVFWTSASRLPFYPVLLLLIPSHTPTCIHQSWALAFHCRESWSSILSHFLHTNSIIISRSPICLCWCVCVCVFLSYGLSGRSISNM